MKSPVFNSLLMISAVVAAWSQIRSLPARKEMPPATVALAYRPVELAPTAGPLRLAGAWQMHVGDPRFGGISALALDRDRFVSVSDRGSAAMFDRPGRPFPQAWVADLRDGPGPWGQKWSRDSESLAADPAGRGWWVGYEQHHSLWLYDRGFTRALARVGLDRPDWWPNRGAEGLLADESGLLALGENGRDAIGIGSLFSSRVELGAGADVADAARAPDGTPWLLLRSKSLRGISQSIAPLVRSGPGFRAGPVMALPKAAFDNYEGMAIEARPGGGLRFWLISDDGHRIMARTLLVALDYDPPTPDSKSPATGAGLSNSQSGKRP